MMNGRIMIMSLAASVSIMSGCNSSRHGADASGGISASQSDAPETVVAPVIGGVRPARMVAKVHIYKTNGDYDNNVPVTLDASRSRIVSFPAPGDISPASKPVKLDGGYLLDRRGVGMNTAFTRYTYKKYMSLQQAPTVDELLEAVIPDARVTEVVEMPFAVGSTDEVKRCNELISAGLPGCTKLYPSQEGQVTITL